MTEIESSVSRAEALEPRRACLMNSHVEQYCGQLLRYYDNPSNDARRTHEARWARHYREEYNKPGNWLRETALALQNAARGRRVLELACGHCRWTPFIAEVAES